MRRHCTRLLPMTLACLVAPVAGAETVRVFESSSSLTIRLGEADEARALFEAIDVTPEFTPGDCPAEDVCYPATLTKTVSSGAVQFYCIVAVDGSNPYCLLQGHYSGTLSFNLTGDAGGITAAALARVGNPYQTSNGYATIACDDATCQVLGNAFTEYWLDGGNFIFALHQYGGYGRSLLRPSTYNDEAARLFDVLNVPEEVVPDDRVTKSLRAGDFLLVCTKSIASFYVYRFRCNTDIPIPDGPRTFPLNVTSTLSGLAASQLYDALDVPGPVKEFHSGDGLYSFDDLYDIVCTVDQCDIYIRRPPLGD